MILRELDWPETIRTLTDLVLKKSASKSISSALALPRSGTDFTQALKWGKLSEDGSCSTFVWFLLVVTLTLIVILLI